MININSFFRLKNESFSKLFSCFVIGVLGMTFVSLLLALMGLHYAFIFKILFSLFFLFFAFISIRNYRKFFSKKIIFFLAIVFLWIFVVFSFSVPTIFSGRDQGSLSYAAVHLSQNHKLTFSFPAQQEFFEIYGSGKALNFPGFFYTSEGDLTTQFPLGYISFLALFYAVFGLVGLKLANSFAFFIFIVSFYFISQKILKPKNCFWPTILVLSSFAFSWFFKFTLGENLALALLWFSIWKIISWWEKGSQKDLFHLFLASTLLVFVRVEALIFVAIFLVLIFLKTKKTKKFLSNFNFSTKLIFILTTLLLVFTLFLNQPFYKVILKSFVPDLGSENNFSLNFLQEIFHTFNILSIYSLLIFLAFSVLGAAYLFKKRGFLSLLPLVVISPTLIFLFDPGISNDHPWMLRRFLYSIIPAIYLYAIVFLENFFKKRITFFLLAVLLMGYNLMVSLPYFSFIPQGKLLMGAKNISRDFGEFDLILVDRMATGDPYAMAAGPMQAIFQKQAVYFFNVNDFSKIDLEKFERIFFIVPDENIKMYVENDLFDNFISRKEYVINREFLKVEESNWQLNLPVRESVITRGKVYEYVR